MEENNKERGLYAKYNVERLDGKPVGKCFVLELDDPLAKKALVEYIAAAYEAGYKNLAHDLCQLLVNQYMLETSVSVNDLENNIKNLGSET